MVKMIFIVLGVNQKKTRRSGGTFYDRYYAALCSYVSKFLSVSEAVEDLVQEVFLFQCGKVSVSSPIPKN